MELTNELVASAPSPLSWSRSWQHSGPGQGEEKQGQHQCPSGGPRRLSRGLFRPSSQLPKPLGALLAPLREGPLPLQPLLSRPHVSLSPTSLAPPVSLIGHLSQPADGSAPGWPSRLSPNSVLASLGHWLRSLYSKETQSEREPVTSALQSPEPGFRQLFGSSPPSAGLCVSRLSVKQGPGTPVNYEWLSPGASAPL